MGIKQDKIEEASRLREASLRLVRWGEGPARRYPWYQKSISSRAGGSKAAWIFSSRPSST